MLATANPYERYKQQGVLMANPVELIVMLYDGCIKQLKFARIAINEKNFEKANNSLHKAQAIVMELLNSLDFHYPVSKELMNIYEFVLSQITQINMQKNERLIEGIINLMTELRNTWVQVQKMNRSAIGLVEE